MSDENTRLNVEIRQTAKGTGIQDTARDLRGMASAAEGAGRSGAKGIAALGETVEKSAAAGRGLADVFSGNVGGLGAILKGLAAFISGPFGWAIAGVGIVAAVAGDKFTAAYQKKKAAIDETKLSIDEAKKAAEELGSQRLQTLRENMEAVAAAAERTYNELAASIKAAEELADLEDQIAESRDADDKSLSNEDRVWRANRRADAAAERKSKNAERLAEGAVVRAKTVVGSRGGDETKAAEEYKDATAALETLRAAKAAAEQRVREVLAERNARFKEIDNSPLYETERQGERRKASDKAAADAAPAVAVLEELNSEAGKAKEAALVKEQEQADKRLGEAKGAAIKAVEQLIDAERKLAALREQEAAAAPMRKELRDREASRKAAGARAEDDRAAAAAVEKTGAAGFAEGVAGRMKSMPGYNVGETADFREAAASLMAAAKAAQAGGATAMEASALLEAMQAVEAALKIRDQKSAELERQIKTLSTQIQTMRTR